MGLIDLFQKTRETSMEMKPQEDDTVKVVKCKGCGAAESLCLRQEPVRLPALRPLRAAAGAHAHPPDRG